MQCYYKYYVLLPLSVRSGKRKIFTNDYAIGLNYANFSLQTELHRVRLCVQIIEYADVLKRLINEITQQEQTHLGIFLLASYLWV